MTCKEFNKWATRHCAMFVFDLSANAPTFALWFKVFAEAGYSVADLDWATDALAARTAPLPWLRDHLPAIHAAIRNKRIDERREFDSEKYIVPDDERERGRKLLQPFLGKFGRMPRDAAN